MAIRNIVKIGDEILRKKSRAVEKVDGRIIQLLNDMKDTLIEANGLGLAAPQVGILKRIALVFDGEKLIEIINPEIIEFSGEQLDYEGCLSLPGRYGEVRRPSRVTVSALDRKGKKREYRAEGLVARAFCHEIDHLNGEVFSEKVERWMPENET